MRLHGNKGMSSSFGAGGLARPTFKPKSCRTPSRSGSRRTILIQLLYSFASWTISLANAKAGVVFVEHLYMFSRDLYPANEFGQVPIVRESLESTLNV